MQRILSPSILSADFGHLAQAARMLDRSAAEWVHVDVMDGLFVPNISFGFPVLKALRRATRKVMDVHLMIVDPERYVKRFIEAGADIVTVHYEATRNLAGCLAAIRRAGAKAGLSIKPGTPVEVVDEWLPQLDLVLVMSVEPGFGGQSYIAESTGRIARLREMIGRSEAPVVIEVDGGISVRNAREVFDAGAEVLVTGSAVFGAEDPELEIEKMLNV